MATSFDESEFERAADVELRALDAALNAVDELEADLESGILTVSYPDDEKVVVNSHRAARQIWMAAARTAWHFDRVDGRWVAGKTGDELWSTLERVLGQHLGRAIKLR